MRKDNSENFSKFIDGQAKSNKEQLIENCKKYNVSIYVDDVSETSSGVHAELRAVVSEAELERRLNAKRAASMASRANFIAFCALLISAIALAKPFF